MSCANMAHFEGGEWLLEREGEPPLVVRSGQVVCIPPDVRHRSEFVTPGTSISRWLHFSILLCGYVDLFSLYDPPITFDGSRAARLGEIIEQLVRLRTEDDSITAMLRRKVLEFELATIIVSASTPREQNHIRLAQLERIVPALEAIRGDLAAPHTRDTLAAQVHLSPSRFAAVFKDATGLAPMEYLQKSRIQRAEYLLRQSTATIEQIAAQVGYHDPFYFSRLFKDQVGMSPSQFRKSD